MPDDGTVVVTAENTVIGADEEKSIPPGRYVAIGIRDTGHGILPKDIDRIFVPYFTTRETGTGFGLTISYSIVRRHDGRIDVTSKPGEGSLFTILLPASQEDTSEKPAVVEETVKKRSILLMDDEVTIRTATGKILQRLGYEVAHAEDGATAVALYREAFEHGTPFDLLILDLTVPGGMGGLECLDEVHAINPKARAVVSSGYSADPIMSEYEEYGFVGVVAKPYSIAELSAALKRILDG